MCDTASSTVVAVEGCMLATAGFVPTTAWYGRSMQAGAGTVLRMQDEMGLCKPPGSSPLSQEGAAAVKSFGVHFPSLTALPRKDRGLAW